MRGRWCSRRPSTCLLQRASDEILSSGELAFGFNLSRLVRPTPAMLPTAVPCMMCGSRLQKLTSFYARTFLEVSTSIIVLPMTPDVPGLHVITTLRMFFLAVGGLGSLSTKRHYPSTAAVSLVSFRYTAVTPISCTQTRGDLVSPIST